MSMADGMAPLPTPPENLSAGDVVLRLDQVVPADPIRDFVPYYHFRILIGDGSDVGHINFRVGDTEHVRLFAGHIGFKIVEGFRGHGYARQACQAIAPLVRSVYKAVIITCDPDNLASMRTIERLGATFIDEVTALPPNPHEQPHRKRRYTWTP